MSFLCILYSIIYFVWHFRDMIQSQQKFLTQKRRRLVISHVVIWSLTKPYNWLLSSWFTWEYLQIHFRVLLHPKIGCFNFQICLLLRSGEKNCSFEVLSPLWLIIMVCDSYIIYLVLHCSKMFVDFCFIFLDSSCSSPICIHYRWTTSFMVLLFCELMHV